MQPHFFDPDLDAQLSRISALSKLATFRREKVSDEDLELYERALAIYGHDVVAAVCRNLSDVEPQQYEPRFPTLATFKRECEKEIRRRLPKPTPPPLPPHVSLHPKEKFDAFMAEIRKRIGRKD